MRFSVPFLLPLFAFPAVADRGRLICLANVREVVIFPYIAFMRSSQSGGGSLRMLAANKQEICNFPPGNPANFRTQSVASASVSAHLESGDWLG